MAKRKIMVKRSTRKGNKVFFGIATRTTPVVNIDIITGMNWDYTFTNSYSTISNGKLSAEPIK